MTTYYEVSNPGSNNEPDWDDPTVWNQQAVPDSVNDGVILTLNQTSPGGAYTPPWDLTIKAGESFTIGSLNVAGAFLYLAGTLSVASNITLTGSAEINMVNGVLSGGHIVLGGYQLGGSGTVTASGGLENQGLLYGDGLTVSGATIYNSGTFNAALGTLLVEATRAGGLLNVQNGDLVGGTYAVNQNGTLDLKSDGVITTLSATIDYGYGYTVSGANLSTIASYDPASGQYVPIQDSLTAIAHSGVLDIIQTAYTTANALRLDGTLVLDSGTLAAHSLTIGADGTVDYGNPPGNGSPISTDVGYITNDGEIVVAASPEGGFNVGMLLQPALDGSGSVVIGPAVTSDINGKTYYAVVSVELQNAVSNSIVFSDGTGTLTLDAPQSFTGTVKGFQPGDSIVLPGIALSSVTGYSYSGGSAGGVLTIDESGKALALAFSGEYSTQSFTLSAAAGSSPGIVIGEAAAGHVALVGVPAAGHAG